MTAPQQSCRRCADLDGILDTLTEIIRRLTPEHPAEAPEQPAAATERLCGHLFNHGDWHRQLRCNLNPGHGTPHDNGRGAMWARSS